MLAPAQGGTIRAAAFVRRGLQRWWERLGRSQLELFNQLGREVGAELALPLPKREVEANEGSALSRLEGKVLALYSLNGKAMARVKAMVESEVGSAKVLTFDDTVGGGHALREAARSADIFLVVTGAATHSATGFIDANRRSGLVTLRTHGKGSASMLRVLETFDI